MTHRATFVLALALAVLACRPRPAAKPAGLGAADTAFKPSHVDSVVPREVALERFRQETPQVDTLSGGAASRDELVRRWVKAIETKDTAELDRLLLTRAEFAWIYYPTNPQGLPPYDLNPQLMWFMNVENSNKGLTRMLEDRGGRPMHFLGYRCEGASSKEGENEVFGPCLVRRLQAPGDTVEERLFGLVLERRGRWKFVNYSGKFD